MRYRKIEPKTANRWMHINADKNLAFFPKWFTYDVHQWGSAVIPTDIPTDLSYLGFPLFRGNTKMLDPIVTTFLDTYPFPIAFTLASFNIRAKPLFEKILAYLKEYTNKSAIFIGLPNNKPEGKLPENILYLEFAPFNLLFEKCSIIFHHCGVGTMSEALCAGKKQILLPLSADQFDNARRIELLGCGIEINQQELMGPQGKKLLADTINQITNDTMIQEKVESIKQKIISNHFEKHLENTVDSLIQHLSQEKRSTQEEHLAKNISFFKSPSWWDRSFGKLEATVTTNYKKKNQ